MTFETLKEGDQVTLEVAWGSAIYPIKTEIVARKNGAIALRSFVIQGKMMEFGSEQFQDMTYNLVKVGDDYHRYVWNNVLIRTVVQNQKTYYIVKPEGETYADSEERRKHRRMLLEIPGTAFAPDLGEHEGTIYDLSESGISILLDREVDFVNRPLTLQFSELIYEKKVSLEVQCNCVRKERRNRRMLYGCHLPEVNKDLMLYVFLKRMQSKK